jgi:hypothetical protein
MMDLRAARRRRIARARGLTAVEAAVVFAIVGSLLAVAVPAFVRELRASRFVEPVEGLQKIGAGALAYAENKPAASAFPPSAPLTPASVPRGTREVDPPGVWENPTWKALNFRAAPEGCARRDPARLLVRLRHDARGGALVVRGPRPRRSRRRRRPQHVRAPRPRPGRRARGAGAGHVRGVGGRVVRAAVALLAVVSALGVARVQPRLASTVHEVKQQGDVYLLPPPSELRAMTLGYHAAAADAIWAKLIVEYGTHWQEKRPFAEAPRYLDAILALEPTYPLVYKYADTLIVYRPPRGTEEDWYTAKTYLERGIRERPWDHEVWLHYGQFLAFMSVTFVTDKQALDGFRRQGAEAIMKAVELGADVDTSLSAATLLNRYGERDAAIRELGRKYALTDDDHEREQIAIKLAQLEATAERDAVERDRRVIEERWRKEYNFLTRDAYLLLGPIPDPLRCGRDSNCPRDWNEALK